MTHPLPRPSIVPLKLAAKLTGLPVVQLSEWIVSGKIKAFGGGYNDRAAELSVSTSEVQDLLSQHPLLRAQAEMLLAAEYASLKRRAVWQALSVAALLGGAVLMWILAYLLLP